MTAFAPVTDPDVSPLKPMRSSSPAPTSPLPGIWAAAPHSTGSAVHWPRWWALWDSFEPLPPGETPSSTIKRRTGPSSLLTQGDPIQRQTRLTADEIRTLIADYVSGASAPEAAAKYDIHEPQPSDTSRARGVPPRATVPSLSSEQLEEALIRRANGALCAAAARPFGVHRETVRRTLKKGSSRRGTQDILGGPVTGGVNPRSSCVHRCLALPKPCCLNGFRPQPTDAKAMPRLQLQRVLAGLLSPVVCTSPCRRPGATR